MILIGCWRILTNKKTVEKATMESKTEGTMWKIKQNCIRDSYQKWPCILFRANYPENKQCLASLLLKNVDLQVPKTFFHTLQKNYEENVFVAIPVPDHLAVW